MKADLPVVHFAVLLEMGITRCTVEIGEWILEHHYIWIDDQNIVAKLQCGQDNRCLGIGLLVIVSGSEIAG